MNYLLTFLLLMNSNSYGVQPPSRTAIFQPFLKSKNPGTYLVSGAFEDMKVMDPPRRNIAYWSVRQGPVKVEHVFKSGKLYQLKITENTTAHSKELIYVFKNNNWYLTKAVKRLPLRMTAELIKVPESQNVCSMYQKLFDDLKTTSKKFDTDICEKNLEEKIIDPVCKTIFSSEEYELLKNAYVTDLTMPDSENRILTCLKSFKTQNILANAYKITDQAALKTQIEVIEMSYKKNAEKYHAVPELLENKIKCAFSPTGVPAAITDSNGVTTYYKAKDAKDQKFSGPYFEKLAGHELIHVADVTNENTTKNLVSICFDNASKVAVDEPESTGSGRTKEKLNSNTVTGGNALPTEQGTNESMKGVAANTNPRISEQDLSAAVPQTMTLAQTATPPAAQLTQSVIDSSQAADGSATGVRPAYVAQVVGQGEGVLNRARSLLNLTSASVNTLAQAGPSTLRGPASTYTAKEPEAVKSLRTIASTDGSASGGQRRADSRSVGSELPTLNTNQDSEAKPSNAAKVAGRNEIGDDGSASSGGRGPGSALRQAPVSNGGAIGTNGNSQSSPVTRNKASSKGNSDVQKILVNFEKPELYQVTKSKIDSSKFKKTLEENNITVLNLSGETRGASNGNIVYLDEGTRFVRQK